MTPGLSFPRRACRQTGKGFLFAADGESRRQPSPSGQGHDGSFFRAFVHLQRMLRVPMPEPAEQIDSTVEIVTPENIAFHYRVAGPFRRLPAYILDLFIRWVVITLL